MPLENSGNSFRIPDWGTQHLHKSNELSRSFLSRQMEC